MSFRTSLSMCVFSLCLLFVGSTIHPKKAERPVNGTVQVSCGSQDSRPLTGCALQVWLEHDDFPNDGYPLNLVRGGDTGSINVTTDAGLQFRAAYVGRGLDQGDCGVAITELAPGRFFVQCGTKRDSTQDWNNDTMALVVYDNQSTETTDDTQREFRKYTLQEKDTSDALTSSAPGPIDSCQLFLPHQPLVSLTSSNPLAATSWYRATLQGHDCSVSLLDVDFQAGGIIWCLYQERGIGDWKAFDPILVEVKAAGSDWPSIKLGLIIATVIVALYVCWKICCRGCRRGSGGERQPLFRNNNNRNRYICCLC